MMPVPDRNETDQSLRTERASADDVIDKRQTIIEEANLDADAVLTKAREVADFVLAEARATADQTLKHAFNAVAVLAEAREVADSVLAEARARADQTLKQAAGGSRATVTQERARADATVRDDRASADESLHLERIKQAIAFSKLLPLEREKTDRYLLTERARSDDVLANRDDFLGMVTHDLRDMLGGIVVSAELLRHSASDNEEGKKILVETQRMQRYAARMNRLIGDLIDVASIDAGKFFVKAAPGDCNALIAEAADTFHAAATAKDISLVVESDEGSLPADFDHERLLQVLANLLTNSIKFTPDGGRISIRCEGTANARHFSVTDSGPGIPGPLLESIFERFWQVGKHDRRGLGLGLYISRCIVEAHGGRIWAESAVGEGATVSFSLPTAGSPQA